MNPRFACFRSSLALLFTVVGSVLSAAEPEFFYYYRGAKKALDLDESSIAVKINPRARAGVTPTAAEAKAFAGRASALGYKASEAAAFRPGGWIKVETRSAKEKLTATPQASRKEKQTKLIDDLAKLDDVDFVSPVFRDDNGQPVNFDGTLLIGFTAGTSETLQMETLKKIPNVKSLTRQRGKNKWQVEMSVKNGIAVLDTANGLAALPFVRYADPNYTFAAVLR